MTLKPSALRRLASWYGHFVERAGSSSIWDVRLLTAKRHDAATASLERGRLSSALSPALVPVRVRDREPMSRDSRR